jgi:uncharacterized protein DUF6221
MIIDETPRTDLFRWYCRLCGAQGEHEQMAARDRLAEQHLEQSECGLGIHLGRAETGRLLEVWTYTPRKLSFSKAHSVEVARINELVAFLLARIADDAQVARDAGEANGQDWTQGDQDPPNWHRNIVWLADEHQQSVKFPDERSAAHSARWDPARVLAECDAKQLMAEQLRHRVLLVGPDFLVPALQLVRAFARAYRDHPDYRPEWND